MLPLGLRVQTEHNTDFPTIQDNKYKVHWAKSECDLLDKVDWDMFIGLQNQQTSNP